MKLILALALLAAQQQMIMKPDDAKLYNECCADAQHKAVSSATFTAQSLNEAQYNPIVIMGEGDILAVCERSDPTTHALSGCQLNGKHTLDELMTAMAHATDSCESLYKETYNTCTRALKNIHDDLTPKKAKVKP